MKPPEIIETERLILRKPRMDDAPAMFAGWTQDPEVTHFLTWRPHENIGQTESLLARAITEWEGDSRFHFMITLKNGGLIGRIGLRIEGHKVELGYVMNRSFQGKGYMTETVRAIIHWAFLQPNIYRVYATYLNHFTQPDSIVPDPYNSQDYDRYAYARNNPIRYNDPSGHCPVCIIAIIGVFMLTADNIRPEVLTASAHQNLIANKYTQLAYNNQFTDLEKGVRLINYAAKLDSDCTSCFVQNVGAVLSGGEGIIQPPLFDLTKNKSFASPYYQDDIGQSGFSSIYQDPSADQGGGNQLHHYWYFVQVGYETDNRNLGYAVDWAHENILGDPKGMSLQDLVLGHQGVDAGIALRNGRLKPTDMGQWMFNTLSPQGTMHAQ